MTNTISVFDKQIPIKIEVKNIFDLKFWKENPRVNSTIKRTYGSTDIDDNTIESVLTDQENVRDLFQKIKKHGGLIDEILIKNDVVLEGNSRLCAYRMLFKKAKEEGDEDKANKWLKIRCKVLPIDTSDEAIFTILGTYHIDGKKQWNTFEKAAYLKRMKEGHGYSSERVGQIINSTEKFVDDNIKAHDLMIDHEIYDLDKYSYFIELVKSKAINEAQKEDESLQKKLINAIKNDQFTRANEIRNLPKVLKDKVSRRMLLEDGDSFEDALDVAKDRNPQFDSTFYSHLKKITEKLHKLDDKKAMTIKKEMKMDTNKKDIVRRFQRVVKIFCKKVEME